jgi:hypothetical protein
MGVALSSQPNEGRSTYERPFFLRYSAAIFASSSLDRHLDFPRALSNSPHVNKLIVQRVGPNPPTSS